MADTLRTAIEQRRAKGMELLAKKDIDGVVSFFTPDATVMFPGSDNISGVDAIKEQYQKFYDLGAASIHMEIMEVGPMCGDMAYDRGYVQVLNADNNVMINGKYLALWKKVNGEWLVYVDIFNSNV